MMRAELSGAATTVRAVTMVEALPSAIEHLRAADPIMRGVIDAVGVIAAERRLAAEPDDHWSPLLYGVVGQRQSERQTIDMIRALGDATAMRFPDPAAVLALGDRLEPMLMSHRKCATVRELAHRILAGTLDLSAIAALSDAHVVDALVALPGIGPWTAEQFVVWHLERADALPAGDPAVRIAAQRAYQLTERPTPAALTRLAASWEPYRGIAARYLLESSFGPGVARMWPFDGGRPRAWASAPAAAARATRR